jgi:hypothetical protein
VNESDFDDPMYHGIRQQQYFDMLAQDGIIILDLVPIQVWERPLRGGKQFFVEDANFALTIGAYKDGEGYEMEDDTVPDDATPAMLAALGFVPCTDPAQTAAAAAMFRTFMGDGSAS